LAIIIIIIIICSFNAPRVSQLKVK